MQQPTTITQLVSSAKAKLVLALDTGATSLEKAFVNVLSAVMGGAYQTLWRYGSFTLLQQFARFATYDEITILGVQFNPLIELGRRLNVDDPDEATPSQINVTATVLTPGGELKPGELLTSADGRSYEVEEGIPVVSGSTVTISLLSVDLGGLGDIASGSLEFTRSVAGLSRVVSVAELVAEGQPAETEDAYRQRVLSAEQTTPQGGGSADYRDWSEGVAGVVRAYPYTAEDEIGITEVFILGGSAPDYIPGTPLLESVEAAIETDSAGRPRRPLNDAVTVLPISYATINVHVFGYDGDDDQKTELSSAVDQFLRDLRPWVQGLDPLPRRDVVSRANVGGAVTEIAQNQGNTVSSVAVDVGASTNIDLYYLQFGEHAKLNTLDYA